MSSKTRTQIASRFSSLTPAQRQDAIQSNIAAFQESQARQAEVLGKMQDADTATEISEIRLSEVNKHTSEMNQSIAELIVGLDVTATGIGAEIDSLQQPTIGERVMGIFSSSKATVMRETRVRNADISDNLNNLLAKSNTITSLLQAQLGKIVEQREIVQKSLKETLAAREVTLDKKTVVTGKLDAMIPELSALQQQIEEQADPAQRASLQTVFEEKNAEYNRLKMEEQELLSQSQTQEGHAATYRIYLNSLQTQEATQRVLVAKIKMDTEERTRQWAALLESMKTATVQNNAHAINDVGVAVDKKGREAMAGIAVGTERRLGDMMSAHKANMAQATFVEDQRRKATAEFDKVFDQIMQDHDAAAYGSARS